MKTALIAAASIAALAGLAAAAPASAQSVEIENAVARVIVIVEDRTDVGVEITQGNSRLPPLQLRRSGRDVEIDGGLRRRGWAGGDGLRNCRSGPADARQPGQGAVVGVRDIGRIRLEDAPLIVLRTPRTVEVSGSGAVFGAVGRGARSVDLGSGGCGDWTVANVDGPMSLSVGGSGSIRAGTSRSLEASIGGSGSVVAGATRQLDAAIGGSGDITVARLSGDGDLAIGGSGDIVVREGEASALDVSIAGSGNVSFGGRTRDLSVSIVGSGDVRVRQATGRVSRSIIGSGDVSIGR